MAISRIDVHHHFVPPFYAQALRNDGGDPSGWGIPEWTVEKDAQMKEEEKIGFAFLSITAPGVSILPRGEKQASFSRQANEYAAEICSEHSEEYGFFASIPSLEDPEIAQAEIAYALDVLKADGITLFTRYGTDNHYLGHPDFKTTWDFLDSRGAVVFVHPTQPVDTAIVNPDLPLPMIDYPHETTRSAVDLITSGTVRSHPNVSIILSHAGGTLPYLAERPAAMLPYVKSAAAPDVSLTERFIEDAKSFYFDTALSSAPLTLSLLKEFAKPGHVLFGSDFPYAPKPAIKRMDKFLDERESHDSDFMRSVNFQAALKLFPRLTRLRTFSGA